MHAENCPVLGYYAVSFCNTVPTFRGNLSVPTLILGFLKMGHLGCSQTSVRAYQYTLRNNPVERGSRLLRGISMK